LKLYSIGAVPDCEREETLMAEIEAAPVKGSVFDVDEFASDDDPSQFGERMPIGHQAEFTDGEASSTGSGRPGATPSGRTGSATASTGEPPGVSGRARISVQSP
jgi:hypothetical protein